MFLFNNKKKEDPIPQPAPVPKAAPKPAAPSSAAMNADDFFGDIDGRKNRKKEVKFEIESPEVTGLREQPAEAPEQIFNNVATESISTAGLHEEGYTPGDMKNFVGIDPDESAVEALRDKTHDNDIPFDPDAAPEPAGNIHDHTNPDAFFSNIDRRRQRRQKFAIDTPEVTGLRETPHVSEGDEVAAVGEGGISTDSLRDKPLEAVGAEFGNIAEIGIISTDSLRPEQ